MKGKSNILLTIIFILVLIVTTASTTFAYFASGDRMQKSSAVGANTGDTRSFVGSTGKPLKMEITAELMEMLDTDFEYEPIALEDEISLVANLFGPAGTKAKYSIVFINTGEEYTPVPPRATNHKYEFCVEYFGSDGTLGVNDDGELITKVVGFEKLNNSSLENPYYMVKDATIQTSKNSNKAYVSWSFKFKFYNLSVPQASKKKYGGYFKFVDTEFVDEVSN